MSRKASKTLLIILGTDGKFTSPDPPPTRGRGSKKVAGGNGAGKPKPKPKAAQKKKTTMIKSRRKRSSSPPEPESDEYTPRDVTLYFDPDELQKNALSDELTPLPSSPPKPTNSTLHAGALASDSGKKVHHSRVNDEELGGVDEHANGGDGEGPEDGADGEGPEDGGDGEGPEDGGDVEGPEDGADGEGPEDGGDDNDDAEGRGDDDDFGGNGTIASTSRKKSEDAAADSDYSFAHEELGVESTRIIKKMSANDVEWTGFSDEVELTPKPAKKRVAEKVPTRSNGSRMIKDGQSKQKISMKGKATSSKEKTFPSPRAILEKVNALQNTPTNRGAAVVHSSPTSSRMSIIGDTRPLPALNNEDEGENIDPRNDQVSLPKAADRTRNTSHIKRGMVTPPQTQVGSQVHSRSRGRGKSRSPKKTSLSQRDRRAESTHPAGDQHEHTEHNEDREGTNRGRPPHRRPVVASNGRVIHDVETSADRREYERHIASFRARKLSQKSVVAKDPHHTPITNGHTSAVTTNESGGNTSRQQPKQTGASAADKGKNKARSPSPELHSEQDHEEGHTQGMDVDGDTYAQDDMDVDDSEPARGVSNIKEKRRFGNMNMRKTVVSFGDVEVSAHEDFADAMNEIADQSGDEEHTDTPKAPKKSSTAMDRSVLTEHREKKAKHNPPKPADLERHKAQIRKGWGNQGLDDGGVGKGSSRRGGNGSAASREGGSRSSKTKTVSTSAMKTFNTSSAGSSKPNPKESNKQSLLESQHATNACRTNSKPASGKRARSPTVEESQPKRRRGESKLKGSKREREIERLLQPIDSGDEACTEGEDEDMVQKHHKSSKTVAKPDQIGYYSGDALLILLEARDRMRFFYFTLFPFCSLQVQLSHAKIYYVSSCQDQYGSRYKELSPPFTRGMQKLLRNEDWIMRHRVKYSAQSIVNRYYGLHPHPEYLAQFPPEETEDRAAEFTKQRVAALLRSGSPYLYAPAHNDDEPLPFTHIAIKYLIHDVLFNPGSRPKPLAFVCPSDIDPIPLETIAYASVALKCCLEEWSSGRHIEKNFTRKRCAGTYNVLLQNLFEWRDKSSRANILRRMCHNIYVTGMARLDAVHDDDDPQSKGPFMLSDPPDQL
ncbi:hypothetical protein SCHPADRAFT_947056 [Schizopora paradoxa]|uniref:DUF6532 domain-containing protein n=1 Tax=Schizopora paradoxa TaxID=27342 RepID=A0A0H2R0G7_9AGAM|nr:hypothetical protein SCHPADRAFT_947056 [Schizopora paradoxa]